VKGPSVTIDLLLVIVVLWIVLRGQGKSWIETIFRYTPVDLNFNPLTALKPPQINVAVNIPNPFARPANG
jgi:hypothetical protein